MNHIFVYGSLLFDDVWQRIIKTEYVKQQAQLPGYRRVTVRGQPCPALIKSPKCVTSGQIIFNVKQSDMKLLDQFEGDHYVRKPVTVISFGKPRKAQVYLFKRKYIYMLSNQEWDSHKFADKKYNVQLL